ncbi:DNA alkylation repair protein [Bacillus luteolus]|uniref:DNA alkylation repair protein n=1 Tax=Litchfieldia luteola TaxID=682179 RepID=A0ABR9QJ07_9BACI|nr:DNA alkylation repair protein [Cytobacillus luteolus]MBE4908477.1 DNA alkylation repair protein [Cytobacillus luteolus]MBP1941328.1 3-methyladenine DNA glycosylase AlkD [Cytobacillus luteolus]
MNELSFLVILFEEKRNEENSFPMKKYMKDHFPFLGIKTPLRRELMRLFYKETGILKEAFKPTLVEQLWEKEEREYQYAALDYISKSLKKVNSTHMPLMEKLIKTKSWWDTVDTLSAHPVGKIAKEYPEIVAPTIESWVTDEHLWLRRTAILYQLRYKAETDEDRLYRYILKNANSKEFFIQKAIGWALREYSKTNPTSVRQFIAQNSLAKLSVREGSKYV